MQQEYETKQTKQIKGVSEEWDDIRLRGPLSSKERARLRDGFLLMGLENDEDLSDVKYADRS